MSTLCSILCANKPLILPLFTTVTAANKDSNDDGMAQHRTVHEWFLKVSFDFQIIVFVLMYMYVYIYI